VDDEVTPPARPGEGGDPAHVQDTNPPSRAPSPEPTPSNEPPPPRIPSSEWAPSHVPAGTKVYHSTDPQHLDSILGPDNGIRPAADPTAPPATGAGANQWGGGELGNGFYTHTSSESAQNYTLHIDNPAVLEFETKTGLDGKQSPGGWIGNMKGDDYRQGADFINGHHDPQEIKFHNGGDQLKLNNISVYGMNFKSYAEYKQWLSDMGMD
jgi:hypothetical protein